MTEASRRKRTLGLYTEGHYVTMEITMDPFGEKTEPTFDVRR